MKTENAIKTAIGFFVIIMLGSLIASFVGGSFAAVIAIISPDLISGMFSKASDHSVVRYSFAIGAIWGVFIGAAASGFACFLAAVIKILRIRFEYSRRGKS
jgi:hypothetical protein